jgi:predicted transcriptional regulator
MTQIAISDEVAIDLASAAASRGCDPTDFASALLKQALWEQENVELFAYTPGELAHLHKGMAEADRGEFVPQEDTQAFFEDWKRNG